MGRVYWFFGKKLIRRFKEIMAHGHSAIDNLIALSTLKTYQAGGLVNEDTMLGLFASKVLGKDVPTSLTAGQLPPLSTTGKITPENLSDVWSFLNPPPNPNLVGTGGLGAAEAMGPLVSPKNIGAVMKRVTGLMSRYPKSTVQKGMNELFGYLGKTKVFKGQMARTPLSGKMLQHYFTGKGKQLSYTAPNLLRKNAEKALRDYLPMKHHPMPGGPYGRYYRVDLGDLKKGQTRNIPLPQGFAEGDVFTALGSSTIKATKVSDEVLKLRNYDTYQFRPQYDSGKGWHFQALIPTKIANKLPNFKLEPNAREVAREITETGSSLGSPLFRLKQLKRELGSATATVEISGVDAVFPKLGLGKPFTSLSKPYYYNVMKQKLGDTAKSVR